jgi:hypothetical protein
MIFNSGNFIFSKEITCYITVMCASLYYMYQRVFLKQTREIFVKNINSFVILSYFLVVKKLNKLQTYLTF